MVIEVFTADEYRSSTFDRTSIAIFGPAGIGKTSLLKTLPPDQTVCVDIEAGLKPVQHWGGARIKIGNFADFQDFVAAVAGADLAVSPQEFFSQAHVENVRHRYAGTRVQRVAAMPIIFVDSITDLTRLAMLHAKQQPEAFSGRTGRQDLRGAYGILAQQIIHALKHLQHARGKTVIFSGLLDRIQDEFGNVSWAPQMEGSKAGRELPGIVDQVCTMHFFARDEGGDWALSEAGGQRRLVCHSGNPWGVPAKDRSGNLELTEPADLWRLLSKINR